MIKHTRQEAAHTMEDMNQTRQQAILEMLSHQPSIYNEDAQRVLGNPLGYVEGRPMTQPEIVASIMTASNLRD